jgi:hypothetical protein
MSNCLLVKAALLLGEGRDRRTQRLPTGRV